MSKLFDRIDHAWELAQIDKAEQQVGSQLTGFQLARLDNVGRSDRHRIARSKVGPAVGYFEKLRVQSRMKLLKTGSLMSDLRAAHAVCRACPKCSEDEEGKTKACDGHRQMMYKVMKAIKYAGEENMATRLAQGRVWGEDEAELVRNGSLNKWEQWYRNDQKEGIWPGTKAYTGTPEDLKKLKEEYESLGYAGWLAFLLDNEEISYTEYAAERARLAEYAHTT